MPIKYQLPSLSPEEIEVLRQEHASYFGNLAHQGQAIRTEVEDEHFARSVESAVNAKWIKMLSAQALSQQAQVLVEHPPRVTPEMWMELGKVQSLTERSRRPTLRTWQAPQAVGLKPDDMRKAAMAEMNKIPALANHNEWKGWPGTWAFATAAVNAVNVILAKQAQEPIGEITRSFSDGSGLKVHLYGNLTSDMPGIVGTKLYASLQSQPAPPASRPRISADWLREKLENCPEGDDISAGLPCSKPPGCNASNCQGCGESQPEPQARPSGLAP